MWKSVPRGEWPFWALTMNALWKHTTGHWLGHAANEQSSFWELFTPDGKAVTNQMDLPLGLNRAPVAWANRELRNRGVEAGE